MWHYVGSARESAESVSLPNGHFSFLAGLHCSVSLRPVESNPGPPTTREGWAGVIPANEARSLASAAAARDSVRYEQSERNLPFLSEMMWLLGELGDAGQDFLGCAPHFLPGQGVQLSLEKAKSHASTFRQKASTNSSLHSTHNCVAHFHSGQWIVAASVVAIVEITAAAFVVVDNTGREGQGRYTCDCANQCGVGSLDG